MPVTAHVTSTDGTTNLHTHKGETSQEIADALRPYIGHFARFYPPNRYGHINPQRSTGGWIRAVDGTRVTFYVPNLDHTGEADAFEAFGSYCTTIEPVNPTALFLAARPHYDPAHVTERAHACQRDGIPFCTGCNDWHRSTDAHTED